MVTLVDAVGSTPQEPGAKMLVTGDGLFDGTIGGGKVEKLAIETALDLLKPQDSTVSTRFVEWNLQRDVGMTCGGVVRLYFEAFYTQPWHIAVFGAGHVAQALIRLLIGLECRITCIDPRPQWLDRLPQSPKLTKICSDNMPQEVKHLPNGTFVVLMTMGHATDSPILLEILKTREFPYLGVIGSQAKAARLKKDITALGLPANSQEAFFCPIGLPIGRSHPQEIAISVAAQLIQERDRRFETPANTIPHQKSITPDPALADQAK